MMRSIIVLAIVASVIMVNVLSADRQTCSKYKHGGSKSTEEMNCKNCCLGTYGVREYMLNTGSTRCVCYVTSVKYSRSVLPAGGFPIPYSRNGARFVKGY